MSQNKMDVRELTRINRIIDPWIDIDLERMEFKVTLRTGTQVTIACPLGAAVEIEEAGHSIIAQ